MTANTFDPNLPDDLTEEQITELCNCLREKAVIMNPNVDITKIEIGFRMHTEVKHGKVRFRAYGLNSKARTYFSRDPKHPFDTPEKT